jgi:azurin
VTIEDDYHEISGTVSNETTSAHFTIVSDIGGVITWKGVTAVTLPPMATAETVAYSYTLTGPGTFRPGSTEVTNTATISSTESQPPSVKESIWVGAAPDLTIEKVCNPDSGNHPGDTVNCTITYRNWGDADATRVTIVDDYDGISGAVSNETTNAHFTSVSVGNSVITWGVPSGVTLPPMTVADTLAYSYTLTGPGTFPDGTTSVTNTAAIDSADDTEPPLSVEEEIQVTAEANLTIDKACDPDSGNRPGDAVNCTLTYRNTGDANATSATIEDDYDETRGAVSNETTNAHFTSISVAGGVVAWGGPSGVTIPPMTVADTVAYSYTLAVAGTFPNGMTTVTNTAVISSTESQPQPVEEEIQVDADANLTIDKACDPDTGNRPDDTVNCTLTYRNAGDADATSVTIEDDYDETRGEVSNEMTSTHFTTVSDAGGIVAWGGPSGVTIPPMSMADTVAYSYTLEGAGVFSPGTTDVDNTATISSTETGSLSRPETIQVVAEADLEILKACTPDTDNRPGDTIHCVIGYQNNGDADAPNATIVDDYDQVYGEVSNVTGSSHFAAGSDDDDTIAWGPTTIPVGASDTMEYDYTLAGEDVILWGIIEVNNTATIDSDPTDPLSTVETIEVKNINPVGGVTMPTSALALPGLPRSELAAGWMLLAAMIVTGAIAAATLKRRAA